MRAAIGVVLSMSLQSITDVWQCQSDLYISPFEQHPSSSPGIKRTRHQVEPTPLSITFCVTRSPEPVCIYSTNYKCNLLCGCSIGVVMMFPGLHCFTFLCIIIYIVEAPAQYIMQPIVSYFVDVTPMGTLLKWPWMRHRWSRSSVV